MAVFDSGKGLFSWLSVTSVFFPFTFPLEECEGMCNSMPLLHLAEKLTRPADSLMMSLCSMNFSIHEELHFIYFDQRFYPTSLGIYLDLNTSKPRSRSAVLNRRFDDDCVVKERTPQLVFSFVNIQLIVNLTGTKWLSRKASIWHVSDLVPWQTADRSW